jgi:hypothetical protein
MTGWQMSTVIPFRKDSLIMHKTHDPGMAELGIRVEVKNYIDNLRKKQGLG